MDKFLSRHPTFRARNLTCAPDRALKTKVHVLDTTRNAAVCSLLSKYHLKLSFLMYFHQKFTQWGFCGLNVVSTSKIRCASKNNFHTHASKGVHKIMLKTWYFTKNKLYHRCIDNNWQKIFRTNSWEQHWTGTFDNCFNGRLMA